MENREFYEGNRRGGLGSPKRFFPCPRLVVKTPVRRNGRRDLNWATFGVRPRPGSRRPDFPSGGPGPSRCPQDAFTIMNEIVNIVVGAPESPVCVARPNSSRRPVVRSVCWTRDAVSGGTDGDPAEWGAPALDHGAQFFTVRDERFPALRSDEWLEAGVDPRMVRRRSTKPARTIPRLPGSPRMTDAPKHLAADLDVRNSEKVGRSRSPRWTVWILRFA